MKYFKFDLLDAASKGSYNLVLVIGQLAPMNPLSD